MRMYEIGGCVRDAIIGVPSKDIDFSIVLEPDDFHIRDGAFSNNPFLVMVVHLESMGFEIFLETPEYLTVRARFPKESEYGNLTADFVLARKESDYTDGRRPDQVVPGTLLDDQRRRDFTMNSIGKDVEGNLIDPFNGIEDIDNRVIRAVGDPLERLAEDALRACRALRFSVTKGFRIEHNLGWTMETELVLDSIRNSISDERIQQELSKMFRYDTVESLKALNQYPRLRDAMFAGSVNLDATMKTKGFK